MPKSRNQRFNTQDPKGKLQYHSCKAFMHIYIYIYIIRLLSSRDYIIIRFFSSSSMPLSRSSSCSFSSSSFFFFCFLNNCFSFAILQESSQEIFKLTPPIEFHTGAAAPMVKRGQQQIKGALANQELVAACKQKTWIWFQPGIETSMACMLFGDK